MCDTLFHTRLEWDDHKLSSDHLRKVGEQRRQFNPDLKDDEFELLDVIVIEDDVHSEEIPVASKLDMLDDQDMKDNDEEEEEEEEDQDIAKESEDNKDNEISDDNKVEEKEENDNSKEENNVSKEENDVSKVDNDVSKEENDTSKTENNNSKEENNIAKELNDTAKEDTLVIKKEKEEKYNPANVVGRELVVKTGGYVCRICSMFMKNDEEADLHCQTASHYINFTTITKLHVSKIYFAK